jgi:hypothetical protein
MSTTQHWSLPKVIFPRSIRIPILISLLLCSGLALLTSTLYFTLPPVIPLFYSLARPEEFLADKAWIFLFPAVSLLISLVHIFLLPTLHVLDEFLMKLFAWGTVIMQLLLVLAAVRIIIIIS